MTNGRPAGTPTLAAILAAPQLRARLVTGTPEMLEAPVTGIHVTELLRPASYVRRGELMCTDGSLLTAENVRAFVSEIVAAGAVGLCLGLGEVYDEAPTPLVEACRSVGAPLMTLPRHARFLDLNDFVVSAQQSLVVQRERLGQLCDLVGDGAVDVDVLLTELGPTRLLGRPSLVVAALPATYAAAVSERLPRATLGASATAVYVLADRLDPVLEIAADLDAPCGYGSHTAPQTLGRSIAEARACLRVAQSRGGVVGPADLTTLEALLPQIAPGRLMPFVHQLVEPLDERDRRRNTGLLKTLRAFLEHSGSLEAAAQAEYLHVNTVRNRLKSIAAETGSDPFTFEGRVGFEIGLWAYDHGLRSHGSR